MDCRDHLDNALRVVDIDSMASIGHNSGDTPEQVAFEAKYHPWVKQDLMTCVGFGRDLFVIRAQKKSDDDYVRWLERIGLAYKQAQRWISLTKLFGTHDAAADPRLVDKLSSEGKSLLYELAEPVNDEVWQTVRKKMLDGEAPNIRDLIDRAAVRRANDSGVLISAGGNGTAQTNETTTAPPTQSNYRTRVGRRYGPAKGEVIDPEWYTPAPIIAAVRDVLGVIDLDPASCEAANKIVKATRFFNNETNGLNQEWNGKIFLNPPYTQRGLKSFFGKLFDEITAERVTEAIILSHNYTDSPWCQDALRKADAVCFAKERITFLRPNGIADAPLQGSMFFYFGDHPEKFMRRFDGIGVILRALKVRGTNKRPKKQPGNKKPRTSKKSSVVGPGLTDAMAKAKPKAA
jgi:hypothetical protein